MSDHDFKFDIVRHIATLSESRAYTRELNTVSFNDRAARLDIRAWRQEGENKVPLKGIQLTEGEAKALCTALEGYIKEEESKCKS